MIYAPPRAAPRSPGKGSLFKSLILIVDDVPENLQVLASYLSEAGYEVLPSTSGAKALNFARLRQPDLILLDVSMPEMDGFEVCRCLKNIPELSSIPVLFITARTDIADVVSGFVVGGVDYITKPFNSTELLARVRTHVELKNARDALLKYNEELNRQGNELRRLDEEKNRLLSIVSHDMRAAFGNVISVCEGLLNPDDALPRAETDETLRLLAQEAEHMILLGVNLLNVDAIDHGVLRVRLEKIDPTESVMFVASKHRRSAALNNITIAVRTAYAADQQAAVSADRTALIQVLDNLVSNAVKYSPTGGEILLSVEPEPEAGRVRFSVIDTGPGLTMEDQEKLFAEFASLSMRPSGKEHSFGLGLWIVKRMTEAMGGSVGYGPGRHGLGSHFYVSLPMAT
jgi:two-component system sensor histidine kinase/response regulator